jgi:hypothetical protein
MSDTDNRPRNKKDCLDSGNRPGDRTDEVKIAQAARKAVEELVNETTVGMLSACRTEAWHKLAASIIAKHFAEAHSKAPQHQVERVIEQMEREWRTDPHEYAHIAISVLGSLHHRLYSEAPQRDRKLLDALRGCEAMMTAIVRDQRHVSSHRTLPGYGGKTFTENLYQIRKLLTGEAPAQAGEGRGGWIKVSDQPPPKDDNFLALIEYKYQGHPISERIVCHIGDYDELLSEAGDDIGWTDDVIVEWMPMPAASPVTDTQHEGIISDGFGGSWSIICPECGKPSMEIVRPGKVQCGGCG